MTPRSSGGPDARERFAAWVRARPQTPLQVVDSHTAGNPTRIIVGGVELPGSARTVDAARAWLRDHADHVRRRLDHEPRGGGLTCAVLPLPPTDDTHDLGAVILEPGSYPPMCGHCMIGLATVVHELGLYPGRPFAGGMRYRIRTPAGVVNATVYDGPEPHTDLQNVGSYVAGAFPTQVNGHSTTCSVLYGGDYYLTIDAATIDLPLDRHHAGDIARLAAHLRDAARAQVITDPFTATRADVYQVMFHRTVAGDPHTSVTAVVAPPGVIDRSPCGTGSSALLAAKVDAGAIAPDESLATRSIIGSEFHVRADDVRRRNGATVVSPVLSGSAHITGFSTVVADPADPLADGFPPL